MNEQPHEPGKRPRLNLTTSQVAASALAACCASIVASYLGVAGTVIGAAVGSVVATTGAAVYGQLFRRGGARIRQTLLVNGRVPEDAAGADRADGSDSAAPGATAPETGRTGRFYGVQARGAAEAETRLVAPGGTTTAKFWLPASSTAEQTRVTVGEPTAAGRAAVGDEATVLAPGVWRGDEPTTIAPAGATAGNAAGTDDADPARPKRAGAVTALRRYRKPIGVVAAIVAVFCVSISVGFLAGGPVRHAGAPSAPPVSTTTQTQDTQGAGGGQPAAGTDRSLSSPPTASATPSATPSPSADGTPTGTPSPSQSAGAGATGTATGSATTGAGTGTGTAAPSLPARRPFGAAAKTTSNAP